MLHSIEDLINIDSHIQEVSSSRDKLAERLKQLKDDEDDFVNNMDMIEKRLNEATNEISSITCIADIEPLRLKYGNLQVLDQIETLFKQKQAHINEADVLREIDEFPIQDAENFNPELIESLKLKITSFDIESAEVRERFNFLLESISKRLLDKFKQDLLNSKWDTEHFVSSKKIVRDVCEQSSTLFNLQKLWIDDISAVSENKQYWNFQGISHNFLIKFMYHFSNPKFEDSGQQKQSIELYFRFLDRYLQTNLFHCIDIFCDEKSGLTKEFIHEQFINHTLNPIRNKVTQTLLKISENQSGENIKTMIVLISQIFINDNALIKNHYYTGVGLVSLLPPKVLEAWLDFELNSTLHQYGKIISSPLSTNGTDLVKLLENMYQYFEPCFNIEYHYLDSYKLQIVGRIFLELVNRYNKFIISPDPSLLQLSEEKQLEITFLKLRNILLLEKCVYELRFKPAFIELTYTFNELSGSQYSSIFTESFSSLEETVITIRESIIHRWKKIFKASLSPYFKLGKWQEISNRPDQCSTEIIGAIQKVSELKAEFAQLKLPTNISISIFHALLTQSISYLKDYVIKVNSFSEYGLQQAMLDYEELKKVLQMTGVPQSVQEMEFEEFIKVLSLKYNGKIQVLPFLSKAYISQSLDYIEVRDALNLKYIPNSELDYALYKIL
ncbi:unnamed protein product [Kluyveromyces dobzhanskii CBS 2104]|uniref:WGS project CCBQ000000000 data, contig 00046 n=1 Tax=Kluyveromyces dobzhanskii CBS 2104 TaxID=1427455 RepID=A0A0A8L7C4_9SACH|nr:unnamed protein product [Kluyveromyces dobzhanskii CBS 2104]